MRTARLRTCGGENLFQSSRISLRENGIPVDDGTVVHDELHRCLRICGCGHEADNMELGAGFRPVEDQVVTVDPELCVIEGERDKGAGRDRGAVTGIENYFAGRRLLQRRIRVLSEYAGIG